MIVEMRTYLLSPGSVPEAEARFERHLPNRTPLSPLGGLWHAATGDLHTLIHLWPYETLDQRTAIRAQMMQPPKWPPPLREFLREMKSQVFLPAPFSPALAPARHGRLYEFCIDSFLPGGPAETAAAWAPHVEARARLSPLVFAGHSELGELNQWLHIWAYRDAAHRDEVHAALDGRWPPPASDKLLKQHSVLAVPASCSPLA